MKKFFSFATITLVLFACVFSLTVSAQNLPDCVKNIPGIKISSDTNAYLFTNATYGKVTLFISNNRYYAEATNQKGSWSCTASNQLTLDPDKTTATPPSTGTGGNNGIKPGGDVVQTSTPCEGAGCQTSQPTDFHLNVKLNNPLKVDSIQGAIQLFMNTVVKVAIPFIIVFFIFAGFKFILARGNPTELQTAKKMFFYTLLGALLIFGAWAITNAIVGTINSISA
jgi:hypothetical protein